MEDVRLYRCPEKSCGAVFMVLPAVIARQLWRLWETVEEVSSGTASAPRSTARRWFGRLRADAGQLLQILLSVGKELLGTALFSLLPRIRTRGMLIELLGSSGLADPHQAFAQVAAWIHRIQPGLRLM